MNRYVIESAYAFFHQKQRVYQYSTLDWQKDDIEYAIEDYVNQMDRELYLQISGCKSDYMHNHTRFAEDIKDAVRQLEQLLK